MTAEPMEIDRTTTTYDQVKHKKDEGRLIVASDRLSFEARSTNDDDGAASTAPSNTITIPWRSVAKHQVSPASHAKALLKLILKDGKSVTFRLVSRQELEQIRKDVSARLNVFRNTTKSKKRTHQELPLTDTTTTSYGEMDKTALAVTRSALLAANPTLRDQHHYLVTETQTVTEEDFWETHQSLVEEEYAKISGTTRAGTSSIIKSHLPLQGRVTLGVEEMRQIFVLYPAVHRAYEERVPYELSDEQFWKKYLESEFFHRDRGRLGTTARNHGLAEHGNAGGGGGASSQRNDKTLSGKTTEEEDARAAAVGTDDFFLRYDSKLREESEGSGQGTSKESRKWGTQLAVGQFDLASTFETERGQLLEGPRDEYPPNIADDGKGARVINKYNRHWAMVLHPDEAVAGSNLTEVARLSALEGLESKYNEANVLGGCDEEMRRLVKYANATEEDANHVLATGIDEDDYETLNLSNIEAYYSSSPKSGNAPVSKEMQEKELKRKAVLAQVMASKMRNLASSFVAKENGNGGSEVVHPDTLPPKRLGRELLSALSKKMAADAQTEADALAVVDALPEDFKTRLNTYFRRSSELLRHFYGLRKLEAQGTYHSQKLVRIVQGLEAVYREIESMRKALPQTEAGEVMRKMCLPIMSQLDWAFQLHRDKSGSNTGGFVTVEDL